MATSTQSPLASSVEKTNGAKLSRLLIDGGTTVLRRIFDGYYPSAKLTAGLNAHYSNLDKLRSKRILRPKQWDKLFPPGGVAPDSNTFDITLLYLLLTTICGLTPPLTGWHMEPSPSDTSYEANLARVKFYRNELYGHVTTTGVDTSTFFALFTEISGVLVSLGLDKAEVERLEAEKCGEQDHVNLIIEWVDSEEDMKSRLKTVHQSQTKTQQTVEKVADGILELKETVESLRDRDNGRDDEVLRNLVDSDFSNDIENLLERFQVGTREWVFDKVQNWLDDKSSQHRVMVISGNAGMGKSIIAAVICKRMQVADRLLGSHFCQYNHVRRRKPQLMLQSLAVHFSNALPKYKEALCNKLSRNLGTDLNNMGVEELFTLLFKETLSAVSAPGSNMLMVIDGVDESEYHGRNELLDVIANQFCKLSVWVRFVVTTRPSLNIVEKLKKLNPIELKSEDEKNLEDIRVFFRKKLQHAINPEIADEFVERLVSKSEGLMLYAHFLVLSLVAKNSSVLNEEDLDSSLPSEISSFYFDYFKRLENELKDKLDIGEEHFLNLLSAITASREPLPVGFVSKLLVPGTNSTLAKRKVLRALDSVSALLPIRGDCLHVVHKSVKDWLTDASCYGRHEFLMDENEGHRILADLCTRELDLLKQKGVDKVQFRATEKYALHHGVRHMLHPGVKGRSHNLEELIKAYTIDLETVYARTCVNSTAASEDLLWLKKQGVSSKLSKDSQSVLETLLFLLRKHHLMLTRHPRMFLQTILSEGGKVLSVESANLLRNKYPEIPYMENVHEEMQQGGVVARFECSSFVDCLDVSKNLDYMVCECANGKLQLWSLDTGKLKWTRPVVVKKRLKEDDVSIKYSRSLPSTDVSLFFRSVVFHPTKQIVLPGVLSQAYTVDGDLKPLFPKSNCKFSVCSVSGDKTKILTNCLEDSKCLVLWNLENGSEIDFILSDEDILSFAWSPGGRLVAMSHSSGLICLIDATNGVRKLAQIDTRHVFGMLKFSRNLKFLFCLHLAQPAVGYNNTERRLSLKVFEESHDTFSLKVSSDDDLPEFETQEDFNDSGFLFGDPFGSALTNERMVFALDGQRQLRCSWSKIEMVDTSKVNNNGQGKATVATGIALSLDGRTVYVSSYTTVAAWEVFTGEPKREIFGVVTEGWRSPLCPVREGVLVSSGRSSVDLWDNELSDRIDTWTNLPGDTQMIPMSEERVAFVREYELKVLDTRNREFVSTNQFCHRIVACNSKCQLLTIGASDLLQLLDGNNVLWKRDGIIPMFDHRSAVFSPLDQFLVVKTQFAQALVLDGETGQTLRRNLPSFHECKFVGPTECVFSDVDLRVQLYNIETGELLSVIHVGSLATCLAASASNRLFAIGLENSTPNFKVIKVHLARVEDGRNR